MGMLDTASAEVLHVEGESARKILGLFGIRTEAAPATSPVVPADRLRLEVGSDPSFGPLLRLRRPGGLPVVRITPLTDNDIREIVEAAEMPGDCGIEELLGRVSQLIEELPWLSGMEADLVCAGEVSGGGAALGADVRIAFFVPRSSPAHAASGQPGAKTG
jgi:hypothetical protein